MFELSQPIQQLFNVITQYAKGLDEEDECFHDCLSESNEYDSKNYIDSTQSKTPNIRYNFHNKLITRRVTQDSARYSQTTLESDSDSECEDSDSDTEYLDEQHTLMDFDLIKPLGEGRYGKVYLANFRTSSGAPATLSQAVAIKSIKKLEVIADMNQLYVRVTSSI